MAALAKLTWKYPLVLKVDRGNGKIDEYPWREFFTAEGYNSFAVNRSPFNNCQIFSVASAENVLGSGSVERARDIFKHISVQAEKRLMCVDIYKHHLPKLKEVFPPKEYIWKLEDEYKNLTGSDMVLCLIQIRE